MSAVRPVIAVIGCGAIGTLHLQGLTRLKLGADIFGIEPQEANLARARHAVEELKPPAHLAYHFHDKIDALPQTVDMAIVATGAAVRRGVIESLFNRGRVGFLFLEALLFQRLGDLAAIDKLVTAKGAQAWVNAARRVWPAYENLRSQLISQGPLTITVELGKEKGMAANAVHFLDLAAYLSGSSSGFRLDGSRLMPVGGAERKSGLLEFRGVLTGFSGSGDALIIRSRHDLAVPHIITISAADRRIIIDEPKNQAFITNAAGQWAFGRIEFQTVSQYALTANMVTEMLTKRYCSLPTLADSARLHKQIFGAFLAAMGSDPDDENMLCPIA